MTPTPAEVLDRAADLLEKPGAWTQGKSARNFAGQEVESSSSAATCWCICGAIDRVRPEFSLAPSYEDVLAAFKGDDQQAIRFNDAPNRTQAEVVSAIRQAARTARSEGGA